MKSPLPSMWAGPGGVEAFLREVNLWIDLPPHPHICPCHYVRVLDGVPRVFAEYAAGGSLAAAVRAGRPDTLAEILDVAIQMAWGLQAAHDAGVVHLDVKPANVVLTGGGRAMITDFGLARTQARTGTVRPADPYAGSHLVSSRGMTLAYASPEQVAGRRVGRGSDVWSWAVSVLELFVGGVSWLAGPVAPLVLRAHRPDGGLPPIPRTVGELLGTCFDDDPDRRPQSMQAVADRLVAGYEREVGRAYPRPVPGSGSQPADGLNNKALSLLDLGRLADAEECWDQALRLDRRHLDATYNRGVHRWRAGRATDRDLVRELEEIQRVSTGPGDGHAEHLLGQLHLERGDVLAALAHLRRAADTDPADPGVRVTLESAEALRAAARTSSLQLTDHDARITAVAVASDTGLTLSADEDGRLLAWDLLAGRGYGRLDAGSPTRRRSPFDAVAIAANGRTVLTGGGDRTVRRWDLTTGGITALHGHTGWVTAVAVTPDGRFGVSGGLDRAARLWDLSTGRCLHLLEGHSGAVSSVAVDADARLALSGSWDGTARLWDLRSGTCLRVLDGHEGSFGAVAAVALSPDGRCAVSLAPEAMRFWDLADVGTGRVVTDSHSAGFSAVAFGVDGRHVLSGARDGAAQWWEFATGRCLSTVVHHQYRVISVAVAAGGGAAVTGSGDGGVWMWSIVPGPPGGWSYSRPRDVLDVGVDAAEFGAHVRTARVWLERDDPAAAAAALRDARAVAGYARHPVALELWRRVVARARRTVLVDVPEASVPADRDAGAIAVGVHTGGLRGASANSDGSVVTWDVGTGRTLWSAQLRGFCTAAVSADAAVLLTGDDDGTVRLCGPPGGGAVTVLSGHRDRILRLAMTPDARYAVSASRDGTIRGWDLRTGRSRGVLLSGPSLVQAIAITPDGGHVLTADRDGLVQWWDLALGRRLRALPGDAGRSPSVATSTDGRVGVVGCEDGTVVVWDLGDGQRLASLRGHDGPASAVAVSGDGRHVVSIGTDSALRVWDVAARGCLRVVPCPAGVGAVIALTPDAQLCVGGGDAGRRAWRLDWDVDLPDAGRGREPAPGPGRS